MRKTTHLWLWAATIFVCFIILWPVYWIVKSSFTEATKLYQMPVQYLPVNLSVESYKTLFSSASMSTYVSHTLIVTVSTLLVSVFLCALAGYAFARIKSKGITLVFGFLILSSMIPGTVTVIPLMILWRSLALADSFHGVVLLYFSGVIPFSTIMYATFIGQIPPSLEEAAMIDGTSVFGAFIRIVFPLLKPIIATLCIINAIACINEFFIPLIFTSKNLKIMSTILFVIPRANEFQMPWDTISAAGCLMLLPSIIIVVVFEKNILNGLMMGSIKQ
jgi:ABC-type glycerol-3-phosphate transport system permease component